jgi:hypothetical protein
MYVLRDAARTTTAWAGLTVGSVLTRAASIRTCCVSRKLVGTIWDSTSSAMVDAVLKTT